MKNIPAALILEKNKLASPNPWLIMLDMTLPNGSVIRIVRNTEDVVYQGNTYSKFPFEIEPTTQSSKGEIPTVSLRVGNVTRILQAYLEDMNGLVGSTVKITVVNAAYLSENYAELEMTFDVKATGSDAYWVTFTLGSPNPLKNRFPLYRYIAAHCNWQFKSRECNYSGSSETCKRTLDYCRILNNSKRFGGYMGLQGGGVRYA